MPKRKSTREHLLNTGAMIVGESGLRALTIRGLSLRAGTNTGSFVYHFGNREAFLNELLERWYEPLFTGVRTHANIHLPAFEKLEAILEDVMEFLLRHGQFIAQLVLDALAGERAAIRFISGIHTRHPPRPAGNHTGSPGGRFRAPGRPHEHPHLPRLLRRGSFYPFRTTPSARPECRAARAGSAGLHPQ